MDLRRSFWRFAYLRYQFRSPSISRERLAFGISIFFGFVYATAFWHDFRGNLEVIPGVIGLVVVPLLIAFAHRRIRLEYASGGRGALYRKMLASN
ncbi:hypothetical protein JI743_13745 [Sphingopyxis sp. DHUNG17]|uniref:hypothetical protein n=1 Tax=Sphingopyxis jiangsuensis TaxID=2871171 RepID=UPI00191FCFB6|nr:hypothetical protein [Sphingopyxis lutea]MBL0769869.1 hypothetical protein [Sphingopyxis lutea]